MSCETIMVGGQPVHINRGPEFKEIFNRPDGEPRWCFKCRARREFRYIVTAPEVPSWYGPNPDVKCGTCGTSDGDLFPGREREWEGC